MRLHSAQCATAPGGVRAGMIAGGVPDLAGVERAEADGTMLGAPADLRDSTSASQALNTRVSAGKQRVIGLSPASQGWKGLPGK